MKKSLLFVGIVGLLLVGCSPASDGSKASEPAPETQKSDRGNFVESVGETELFAARNGDQVVSFTISSIAVDVPCTDEYAVPAQNGHFLTLEMAVETSAKLTDEVNPFFLLGDGAWKAIAPDGTTSNAQLATGAALSCFAEDDVLPSMIGPGEKAKGKIVLDVEDSQGILVLDYKPSGVGEGREWSYPQAP
ncbi:hypothetical protein [Arthrobacter sp. UYEF36]|uniref:hypothetical protein n=1 Tax=Arthrobacter sp. UYEF36 TaxID=1756366 RepID=UPI00339B9C1C